MPGSPEHLCDCCGATIAGAPNVLDDGRELCHRCQATGVDSQGATEALRDEVLRALDRLGFALARPAPIRLVDAAEMARLTGQSWRPTTAKDARILGCYQRKRDAETIYIESGQPRDRLLFVLAHESGHDWQSDNNPAYALVPDDVREGFAQWLAFKLADGLRLGHLVAAERARADVYGVTTRRFEALDAEAGIAELRWFAVAIGRARQSRLEKRLSHFGRETVERELRTPYSNWQAAIDLANDAQILEREGRPWAAEMAWRLAVEQWPWQRWTSRCWRRRRGLNFLSILARSVWSRPTKTLRRLKAWHASGSTVSDVTRNVTTA